jgi:hypothetical protein
MDSPLATLRQNAPHLTASQFLSAHPGCFLQYFDDTPNRDPAKALSTPIFDPVVARRKQRERCAVCYSLQAFSESRTRAGLLCYRNLGVDIDLIPAEQKGLPPEEVDCRKDVYLSRYLLPFPVRPHWLVETGSGFHAVFRIQPQRDDDGVREAECLNRRLVRVLQGDPKATLLTQLLRVPGTLQFKDPEHPFFCRLLMDNAAPIPPYPLATVSQALDDAERASGAKPLASGSAVKPTADAALPSGRWREGLSGVAEGQRNATATSLVGKILGRLPEELWEIAGLGGLMWWNRRNPSPLSDHELQAVYESIASRERQKRRARAAGKDEGNIPFSPA